ncbi:MAG: hypothetical protein H6Q86_3290, partial [candidate division NC10 bacterium]|nr:hypothetical protein [candidate division NC10 bacterium]
MPPMHGGASPRFSRIWLPSGHGVEQGDGSAVGYGSVLREETVAQQWPKR